MRVGYPRFSRCARARGPRREAYSGREAKEGPRAIRERMDVVDQRSRTRDFLHFHGSTAATAGDQLSYVFGSPLFLVSPRIS